jgi:hypothetical protein
MVSTPVTKVPRLHEAQPGNDSNLRAQILK